MEAQSTARRGTTPPTDNPPLICTNRSRTLSPGRANGDNDDITPLAQMDPSSSRLSGHAYAGTQWVYVGSFWHVGVSLDLAPEHDAEILATYNVGLADKAGHEVGLVEAFHPTQVTDRDGKAVGSVLNKGFHHAAKLALLFQEFGDNNLRIVSRRKDKSQPLVGGVEAGRAVEPPKLMTIANFKIFCRDHTRDRVGGRLRAWQPLAENYIFVQGFESKVSAGPGTAVAAPRAAAANVAPGPHNNQQGGSSTQPFAQADAHLQAVCASHKNARYLTPSDTPTGMRIPLREHQKTALSWMATREDGKPLNDIFVVEAEGTSHAVFTNAISGRRHQKLPAIESGGILADGMGLGKTLTSIAFILHGEDDAQAWGTRSGPRGESPRSPATLVVVPPTLVKHWEQEVRTKTTLSANDLYVHFGPDRVFSQAALQRARIVLTSSSLISLAGERDKGLFFGTHWYRAMFDEAHEFRNSKTRLARNVLSIKARFRWAITGTPIHNYVSDVQPLLQLINAHPVASKDEFTNLVIHRLQNHPRDGSLVLKALAGSYMIRRKAEDHMYSASFTHVRAEVPLTQQERDLYEEAKTRVMDEIQHQTSCHNALMRFHDMRKICAMGMAAKAYMQPLSSEAANTPAAKYQRVVTDGGATCHACGEVPTLESATGDDICSILSCVEEHVLCPACFMKESGGCPCEGATGEATIVVRADLDDLDVEMTDASPERPSAKIRFIRDEVKAYRDSKFVVMASYVSTVTEITRVLEAEGVAYVRYDGSVSQRARGANMAAFKTDDAIQVLVGTTKSLGQGHSVEQASRLILVDAEWNPQVSEQAKARILRLNQTNDATVTQLVAGGTIEEKVLARAEGKKRLAEAFSDNWSAAEGQGESDLELIKSWFRN